MIEVIAIGGYNEVGRNMTAIKVDDEIVIFDIGLYLPAIVGYEDSEQEKLSEEDLRRIKAIPDDSVLYHDRDKVKAIILGHGHLDHIGAVVHLAKKYKNAKIIGTPYTMRVLDSIIKDKGKKLHNKFKSLNVGNSLKISKDLKIEFFNMTHSIPQTALSVLHTKYGKVAYSLDFKLDNTPVLGNKPNYETIGKLEDVKVLFLDSLYSKENSKTPSEKVAREMLREVLLETDNKGKAIVVTTFSSHIARLKSIVEFGNKLGRKVVFLGRSLNRYVRAAEDVGIINFSKKVEIVAYAQKIRKKLKQIDREGASRYLIVCTGNQAEPGSTLTKIANDVFHFKFKKDDFVIFSCKTIPTEENIKNRKKLEEKLNKLGCRLFLDIHVSGHGFKEDGRELIKLIRPEHLIPAHGGRNVTSPAKELWLELGYREDKIHILNDGQKVKIV
ncbi:RNase J family beta-CASP ribonuclease [Candidatus Woesearchaeota archaeon]|nr:RNase J family beta-CASP ribonuclease [Candidatus Woesearchaeota archaeon]